MERFVRGCVLLVELAAKGYILLGCIFFGSMPFTGFRGGSNFKPELLALTPFSAVFAYLMVAPRRWMPTRWLQDVSYRRTWCVGLALAAPLYVALVDAWLEDTSLLILSLNLIEVLPLVAILLALLALRWWTTEPIVGVVGKIRLMLLPVFLAMAIGISMSLLDGEDLDWHVCALLALVSAALAATFWVTWKRPPTEGDSVAPNQEQA